MSASSEGIAPIIAIVFIFNSNSFIINSPLLYHRIDEKATGHKEFTFSGVKSETQLKNLLEIHETMWYNNIKPFHKGVKHNEYF
jgi:hypothetical protein